MDKTEEFLQKLTKLCEEYHASIGSLHGDYLHVVVGDEKAVYPVTISEDGPWFYPPTGERKQ